MSIKLEADTVISVQSKSKTVSHSILTATRYFKSKYGTVTLESVGVLGNKKSMTGRIDPLNTIPKIGNTFPPTNLLVKSKRHRHRSIK